MGYATERFVQGVDPNLLCAVCGGVLQEAVSTPCGHSFCSLCLTTWLSRPAPPSCPHCRASLTQHCLKPVHALRNLVRALHVHCDYRERGCQHAVTLDLLPSHLTTCPFAPVQCAGCGEEVSRVDLPDHHMTCVAIAASLKDDEDNDDDDDGKDVEEGEEFDRAWRQFRDRLQTSQAASATDVRVLLARIRSLEKRVERLLQEVRCARSKNLELERQYHKVTSQLRHKGQEPTGVPDTRYFLQHQCARTPETIAKLSLLIARHLLDRPRHLVPDDVFCAIRRCHDNYWRSGAESEHDLHMLLATAFASSWFSPSQRLTLQAWLHNMNRASVRPATSLFNN